MHLSLFAKKESKLHSQKPYRKVTYLILHCRIFLQIISSSNPFSTVFPLLRISSPCLFPIQTRHIHPLNCSSNITSFVKPFLDLSDRTGYFLFHAPLALRHNAIVTGSSRIPIWEEKLSSFLFIFTSLCLVHLQYIWDPINVDYSLLFFLKCSVVSNCITMWRTRIKWFSEQQGKQESGFETQYGYN